jgi:hypothetical protein
MAGIMRVCQAGNFKEQIVSRGGGFVKQISLWIACPVNFRFGRDAPAWILTFLKHAGQAENGV